MKIDVSSLISTALIIYHFVFYSFISYLPALPVRAADPGGAGRWREAEAGGDSPSQGGGHTQQQPPPGS